MKVGPSQHRRAARPRARLLTPLVACIALNAAMSGNAAAQRAESSTGGIGVPFFTPGNLVVSRSVYGNKTSVVSVGQTLPPGCFGAGCAHAIANGAYPFVFDNDQVDASFGITAKILLDQITTDGTLISTLEVPNNTQAGVGTNQMVTSFSSKSELALNLSTDGNYLTFMGYVAGVNAIDVSNANTPKVFDPTNLDHASYYRAVAQLDAFGNFNFTVSNAYSGNNGRAALLNNTGANVIYTAGNAGNGDDPQPTGVVLGAGAQIMTPSTAGVYSQNPGLPTPVGSFNITQLSPTTSADKIGKDDNFRGLTAFNEVLYFTKGSGSNGVNTVYFLDTTGGQCSPNGQGLPSPNATLPTLPLAYDPTQLATNGLEPSNMCILAGFPAATAKSLKKKTTAYPFGVWFANTSTAYVADEGDGSGDVLAGTGLEKWVLMNDGKWHNVYTLQNGLGLGATYSFPGNAAYPTGLNPATGIDWAPLTAGLRNLTGRVNNDGTVTIWAVTSTFSGSGDNGADPNKLVAITDVVSNLTAAGASSESFVTIRTAAYGEVLRGVSFAPGHAAPPANHQH